MSQDAPGIIPTHIVEILNTDIKELQEIVGEKISAEEDVSRKGFKIIYNGLTSFLDASSVKVVREIRSKSLITPLKLLGFFVTSEKIVKIWVWNPSETITPFEMASLFPYLLTSGTSQPIYEKEISEYLPTWKDHFDIEDLPINLRNSQEFQAMERKIKARP